MYGFEYFFFTDVSRGASRILFCFKHFTQKIVKLNEIRIK